MDEAAVREHADKHAHAVMSGDMAAAAQDLTDEAKAAAPAVMKGMPRPVTGVEIVHLTTDGGQVAARISYRGDDREHLVESFWEDRDGRPMIVDLRVAE